MDFTSQKYMESWDPRVQQSEVIVMESYGWPIKLLVKMKGAWISVKAWLAGRGRPSR
jgi:hypothetical protein